MKTNKFWDNYYTKALSTAIYPNQGDNLLYPVLGIIGECSEISNKVKKILRDDECITDKKIDEIGEEIGDCIWYVANICREVKISMLDTIDIAIRHYHSVLSCNNVVDIFDTCLAIQKPLYGISINAKRIKDGNQNDFLIRNGFITDLRDICVLLIFICKILGLNFEAIGKQNIEKLLDRKQRDVLRGSGDNR